MLFEHETLLGLADRLTAVAGAADAASTSYAIQAVFVGHVRRESELLLPAPAADPGADLPALLPDMGAAVHRLPDRRRLTFIPIEGNCPCALDDPVAAAR